MNHELAARRLRRLAATALAVTATSVPVLGVVAATAHASTSAICEISVIDDTYSTVQDTALTVASNGVVSNDLICATDGLVISTSSPSHGTLANFDDGDGGFKYTPDPGFTGTDSFTYVLEDVEGSPTATVTITVTPAPTTTVAPTTTATPSTVAPTTTVAPHAAPAAQAVTRAPTYTG